MLETTMKQAEAATAKADLDWANLGFGYHKTDYNIRLRACDGQWDDGELVQDDVIPLHMAATCLHYGQECFEGLKAYETRNGDVVVFRVEENARRMIRTCERIMMQPIPEDKFIDAVFRVVNANRRFVPPYGTGATLYIRPLLLGTSGRMALTPSAEYLFLVFVTPVGPYFKDGFKPVDLIVEDAFDRAAPAGVGNIKVGGNYAAGLRASMLAKQKGYADVLYLDPRAKRYVDEAGPANFFGITRHGQYVTPDSESILPSITNKSLMQLGEDMGLNPTCRPVEIEEIFEFAEAGCCGTAAVITPIRSITFRERKMEYCEDGEPGPICSELYNRLTAIQFGEAPDPYGWVRRVPAPDELP